MPPRPLQFQVSPAAKIKKFKFKWINLNKMNSNLYKKMIQNKMENFKK